LGLEFMLLSLGQEELLALVDSVMVEAEVEKPQHFHQSHLLVAVEEDLLRQAQELLQQAQMEAAVAVALQTQAVLTVWAERALLVRALLVETVEWVHLVPVEVVEAQAAPVVLVQQMVP
jgi:hypothetical protein